MAGIALVGMAVLAVKFLVHCSKEKWVEVDCDNRGDDMYASGYVSTQEYEDEDEDDDDDGDWDRCAHVYSVEEYEDPDHCDLRGPRRPFNEPGHMFMEHMLLSNDHIWQTTVPNCGHDGEGETTYNYTMIVDYNDQTVAFRTAANNEAADCYVGNLWDLGLPEEDQVAAFLEDPSGFSDLMNSGMQTVTMNVQGGVERHFLEASPFPPGRSVGDEISALCQGATMWQLENIDQEIEQQLEDLFDFASDLYEDLGPLMLSVAESLDNLDPSDLETVANLLQDMSELLFYMPNIYEIPETLQANKPGMAVSLNIRGNLMNLEHHHQMWPGLVGYHEGDQRRRL